MRVHFPELYEAHKLRTVEDLTLMALTFSLTYEQFKNSNWNSEGTLIMSDEIDNDVTMPAEPAVKTRKPRKPKIAKGTSQAETLQAALAFVSPVENSVSDFSKYVNLNNKMATMYNGQMAAGHPIEEELTVCPQITKLIAALKRAGKTLALTETDAGQLSIKGDSLRVLVPCIAAEDLNLMQPDAIVVSGDFNVLKEAFKCCGVLASEKADRVLEASLLLEANTCTGTNGFAILQYWHGIAELPPAIVLPKIFCAAIAACPLDIVGIGGTFDNGVMSSFTVWFAGGAWLKTQCYHDRWPNLSNVLDIAAAPTPIAPELVNALDAIEPFLDEEQPKVYFQDGFVQTHEKENIGAQFKVPGLTGGLKFNGKVLKTVAPYFGQVDLTTYNDKCVFFGGSTVNPVRGVFMGLKF